MTYLVVLWLFCATALLPSPVRAQSADTAAIPEMARLAKVLAGDWNTVEIVQHGQPVPKGAGRRGTVTPNSHTLIEAQDTGNGVIKPYVVSHTTRQ